MRVKNICVFILCLLAFSCKKSEDKFELRHDGENFSAPLLDQGIYTGAVKFTDADLSSFQSKQLTKVTFYTLEVPSSCELIIFKHPSDSSYGEVLYQTSVQVKAETWNEVELSSPIDIPSDQLWLGIKFTQNSSQTVLGCDQGPAVVNGEWLFHADTLQTLNNFRPDVDINWNIRGFVK